ncbi:MAG: response regulator [Proteobacteria bacterium]|nr:response regulator [Pseudomonadota bacterium]
MPKKLLLADDSVTIQKVISITFASDDYELVVVGDGDAAIAKAKEVSPDIILADVAMPGKDGYEVCEAVKGDPALSKIPVMLLAGTFEPLNSDEAARVKADDSIVKPFESQELIDKVNALLASSLSSDASESDESGFELPDEGIPGLAVEADAGSDLDFLEGGIFEEPAEQGGAAAESTFVDLEISEDEFTAADSAAGPFDISEATAPAQLETNEGDFGIPEIEDAAGSFSFEPEAESLEVAETESVEIPGGTEEPFELESVGGEPFRSEPEPFESASVEPEEAVSFDSLEEVVDYGTPDLEVSPGAPAPDVSASTEEAYESVAVEPTELIEEPVAEEASFAAEEPVAEEPVAEESVLEESIESLDDDFTVDSAVEELSAEPEPFEAAPSLDDEPVELYEAALEEVAPESATEPEPVESVIEEAVEAVTEQAVEAVAEAGLGATVSPEKIEEIVAKMAREIVEKVAWEVVPELAEELINAEIKKFKSAMMQSK